MKLKERAFKFGLVTAAVLASLNTNAQELVLEEIIVTAQKRAENIQDVPITISTLDDDYLKSILDGGADIRGLAGRVPSLYVEGSSGRSAPRFYIRGLGNVDFDLSASQPVSIVMDDVVVENVLFKSFPLFDIARTEVLKGPQGTLFGRNTPSGIVKFDTVKPTQETEGYLRASYGTHDAIRVESALGGALSDTVSARFAFQFNSREDYVRNINPDAVFAGNGDNRDDLENFQDVAMRLHLAYQPNDNFNSLLTLQHRDLDGSASVFRANILSPGSNQLNSNFDRDTVSFDGGDNNQNRVETSSATLKMEYDFGNVTLTSLTGYYDGDNFGRGDIDGGTGAAFLPTGSTPGFIPFPSDTGSQGNELNQVTQEIRFSNSNPGKLKWQAGAFYFEDEFELEAFAFDGFGGQEPTIIAITTQETDAWALFGQLSYDVTDKLNITGGLRYSDDNKELTGSRPLGFLGPIDAFQEIGDDHLSWDLSARYLLNEDTNVYARFANGFRAPSIQGRLLFSNSVTTASSETVDSFDIGIKSELLDQRLRLNASAFYYEIDSPQFTAIGGAGNFNQLINAAEGEGKGVELDIEYLASENLKLTLGFSYNDTEIVDSNLLVAPCGGGCTVLDPVVEVDGETRANINGNPFPQAPETILTATARYSIPVQNGEFYAYADYSRTGDTNLFLYESAEFNHDGNFEIGMKLGYINEVAGYEVAVFGRNITDEENLIGGIDFNNLTGFVNDPRIIGVEFSYDF